MGVPFSVKGFLDGQWKVNFTMWETDVLQHRFVAWMPQYDQILVPCEHNVELFSKHHHNVKHVPLGVDCDVWRPMYREPNPVFRIHGGGSLWRRKGLDILVEACRLLKFPHELHIKLAPHAKDNPPLNTMPQVTFHRQWMSQEDAVRFFNQADVWVCPSRGEGFGLIPLQAMACGIPTIITATSGQAQFAHLATGVVPHRKAPASTGMWDEADPSELAAEITRHYQNQQEMRTLAANNRGLIREQFSWVLASQKLAAALPQGELLGDAKFAPIDLTVEFMVNRATEASINSRTYRFVPGVRYVEREGVFEVLWRAGYIDKG
jgi:glycosyltransferase involved in cell wall biosynthesis